MAKKLFVGSLSYDTTQEKLQEVFAAIGQVESVAVIMDRYSGRSKGFAFVEMATEEDAKKAIDALNGTQVDGRNINVSEAKEREPRENRGGYGGGNNRGGGGYDRRDRDDRRNSY